MSAASDAELLDLLVELGVDERRVLLAIARRLTLGRKAYGPLDVHGDRRDWRAEAAEEALACELLRATGDTMPSPPPSALDVDRATADGRT